MPAKRSANATVIQRAQAPVSLVGGKRVPPAKAHVEPERSSGVGGVVVGRVLGLTAAGAPLVTWPGESTPVPALTVRRIAALDVGRRAILQFEAEGERRPVLLGLLEEAAASGVEVELDGERLVLSAQREIVLRCGAASLTLTRAGKVLIDGAYVSSKSSGAQRIRGATIELN